MARGNTFHFGNTFCEGVIDLAVTCYGNKGFGASMAGALVYAWLQKPCLRQILL